MIDARQLTHGAAQLAAENNPSFSRPLARRVALEATPESNIHEISRKATQSPINQPLAFGSYVAPKSPHYGVMISLLSGTLFLQEG